MRSFGEAQSKAMRAYAQSGQYHTIVESRVPLTRCQSHALFSNIKQRTLKEKESSILEGSQKTHSKCVKSEP